MQPVTAKEEDTIPLLDLRAQFATISDEICGAIDDVLRSQQFILGPQLAALEQELATYCGRRFAVGVASGTDALFLALRLCGVGRGDEVILPALTFVVDKQGNIQHVEEGKSAVDPTGAINICTGLKKKEAK